MNLYKSMGSGFFYFCCALFLFVSSGSIMAAMYKCPAADGNMVFADRPCPNGEAKNNDKWISIKEHKKMQADKQKITQAKRRAPIDELEQKVIEARANLEQSKILFESGHISAQKYRKTLFEAQSIFEAYAKKQRDIIEKTTEARKNLRQDYQDFLRRMGR